VRREAPHMKVKLNLPHKQVQLHRTMHGSIREKRIIPELESGLLQLVKQ
jgi:hypothetical protein